MSDDHTVMVMLDDVVHHGHIVSKDMAGRVMVVEVRPESTLPGPEIEERYAKRIELLRKVQAGGLMDDEAYEGLLLAVVIAGSRRVKLAAMRFMDEDGLVPISVANLAIDMLAADVLNFVVENEEEMRDDSACALHGPDESNAK